MNFWQNVKNIIVSDLGREYGWIRELSKKTGIKERTISTQYRESRLPRVDEGLLIAKALEVKIEDLLPIPSNLQSIANLPTSDTSINEVEEAIPEYKSFPRLTTAAGHGIPPDTYPEERYLVDAKELPARANDKTHAVLMVRGTSMVDAGISHRSYVLVRNVEEPKNNALMAVWVHDHEGVSLKRVRKDKGRWYVCWEDGSNKKIELTGEDKVLGEYVKEIKNVRIG